MNLKKLISDQTLRESIFPVTREMVYLGHAGVAPLPACSAEAMREYAEQASHGNQENPWFASQVKAARANAARLIGCSAQEIALLGPTSLGLNLVSHGLDWSAGDEVIYYEDDYPANVYAWKELARQGVRPVPIRRDELDGPGMITWACIESKISQRTRLVSLATCHYLSGYRIDYAEIGRQLHEREVLFCLDAIQTLGAFPMDVSHVDFLAADSHKWMLGPLGAGIFYVKKSHFERLRPALLGSWNVVSPQFIAQDEIDFYPGGRRYEPGALNGPGIAAMAASIGLLLEVGVEVIAERLLDLHRAAWDRMEPIGFQRYMPCEDDRLWSRHGSGILSLIHPTLDLTQVHARLETAGIVTSLREDRTGRKILRLSPHFYTTEADLDQLVKILGEV